MGIVQGLTEFLPISSSGHLVIADALFGVDEPDLFFDTVLHLGTLVAVIAVLWRDVLAMVFHFFGALKAPAQLPQRFVDDAPFRLAILVVVGTIPAVVIGLLFKDTFESLFSNLTAVGIALCITGALLLSTRFAKKPAKGELKTGIIDTLLIGLAQAAAITPGISRSGSTISTAMFLGIDRDLAGRFSFLLSIPAILGAVVLQAKDLPAPDHWAPGYLISLLAGFIGSMVVGYGALRLLIGLVKKGKFFYFGFYCIPVGILTIIGAVFR